MNSVDPFVTTGQWVVTTASGARHLFDSRNPDAPVTVTRLTDHDGNREDFALAALRRDATPVSVTMVRHRDPASGFVDGVTVGLEMWLVLEPLGPDAEATIRRTTPVVTITPAAGAVDEVAATGGVTDE